MTKQGRWMIWGGLFAVVGMTSWFAWQEFQPDELGEALAHGNGRIEATEIDAATKLPGRVVEIFVDEGDYVQAGDRLARMDTDVLRAQLSEAKAHVRKAENATRTATATVALRESEKRTSEAVVAQRHAELAAAKSKFARTESLAKKSVVTEQELDDARAAMQSGEAALRAAESQVLSAQAGIEAARSQVVEAESAVEAANAAVERIEADIQDSLLKAPRGGRVQYRIAEVGEVLPAGGAVLNLVDLSDVYITFFLPTRQAGRVEIGQEARIILDAAPQYVIPAKVTFVDSVAQFTPKTVETEKEREKLMFRIKAHLPPRLLEKHLARVKTGLPGMAYLQLDDAVPWPENLQIKLPQ